jgi:hypothetical protein
MTTTCQDTCFYGSTYTSINTLGLVPYKLQCSEKVSLLCPQDAQYCYTISTTGTTKTTCSSLTSQQIQVTTYSTDCLLTKFSNFSNVNVSSTCMRNINQLIPAAGTVQWTAPVAVGICLWILPLLYSIFLKKKTIFSSIPAFVLNEVIRLSQSVISAIVMMIFVSHWSSIAFFSFIIFSLFCLFVNQDFPLQDKSQNCFLRFLKSCGKALINCILCFASDSYFVEESEFLRPVIDSYMTVFQNFFCGFIVGSLINISNLQDTTVQICAIWGFLCGQSLLRMHRVNCLFAMNLKTHLCMTVVNLLNQTQFYFLSIIALNTSITDIHASFGILFAAFLLPFLSFITPK